MSDSLLDARKCFACQRDLPQPCRCNVRLRCRLDFHSWRKFTKDGWWFRECRLCGETEGGGAVGTEGWYDQY